MRIIPRRIDTERIKRNMPWVMIYGRRKTGKSFLVENFVEYDRFFFVNRDGTVIDKESGEHYTHNEFLKVFREIIENKTVVVDEFHRLPEGFADYLHSLGIKGNLILITSTLWLAKQLIGKNKPLLGIAVPVKIGLVDEREIITELSKYISGKELIEAATYLREVMLIPRYRKNLREFLSNFLFESKLILKELVGEIFTEEEKNLTKVYETVLKAVADGKTTSTGIATELFSRNLILKDNPGVVQKYLGILTDMELLERAKIYGKKKFRYFHYSPLLDLHYYLDSKYAYTEIETPKRFIRKVVDEKVPKHVEQFIRKLLMKAFGLQHSIIERKDLEIDIALFRFKKLEIVAEVKWKNFVSKKEVKALEAKLNRFKSSRKMLFVPNTAALEIEPKSVEIIEPAMLCEIAEKSLHESEN